MSYRQLLSTRLLSQILNEQMTLIESEDLSEYSGLLNTDKGEITLYIDSYRKTDTRKEYSIILFFGQKTFYTDIRVFEFVILKYGEPISVKKYNRKLVKDQVYTFDYTVMVSGSNIE